MRAALLRPRRASDRRPQHRIQQRLRRGALRQPPHNVGEAVVEQQHGKTVHQRPRAYDRGGLIQYSVFSSICSWRLSPIEPASPANEAEAPDFVEDGDDLEFYEWAAGEVET